MPEPSIPPVPEARAIPRQRTRLSLVWLVPIVAAIAGAWVAVTRIMNEGPKITLVFDTAEGLEAGKTGIEYNGVTVGTLKTIRLSDDHQSVVATAQMAPGTENLLVEDTRFWVVKPRISGANVTGLGTLISGSYVGMEIGESKRPRRDFTALPNPPVVAGDQPGRFFVLKSSDLGSLDTGTPVFFRRLQVGEVAEYSLDKDGKAFTVRVFVQAPYDQYVTPGTRFWQASGVDMSVSASGFTLQTQSILSILVGGIAFETPATVPVLSPAEAETRFTLFADRAQAFKPTPVSPQHYLVVFDQSVHGLGVGAPVEFKGIRIGEVTDMRAQFDAQTSRFSVPVTIEVDPASLGVNVIGLTPDENVGARHRQVVDALVSRGLRAQLQSGSLLTGSLMVVLDIFRDMPPVGVDWAVDPPRFPTVPGQIQALEANVANIIKKVDGMDFGAIGGDVKRTLTDLDGTLTSARATLEKLEGTLGKFDATIGSANQLLQPDSLLGSSLGVTLDEVNRAARSLRVLADELERHPEALLRGKSGKAE